MVPAIEMKFATQSISRRLSLVILLTSGSILLIGGGAVAAMSVGPGSFVMLLGASTILLTCATWYASKRLVSRPILDLAETVRELSAAQDYSVRVTKQTPDEVGVLVDSLNGLLEQMVERDQHFRGDGNRLEAEVAVRTRELRESNERLKAATTEAVAADESMGRFVANISHEVRTPMNGIFGMAELLLNTDLTPQQNRFTRAVMESVDDLLSIVNNILDFSKVEAGKFDRIDNQPFSPRECVEKVSDLLAVRAHQEGLALSHECAVDVPNVMLGDGKRLRQVLTNIIGNAIKFTKRGTIVVRTTLGEYRTNATTIRFEVVDTGIGIPTYLHKDIFEGFLQADNSTTRQFGGTGLGLAISKHLVGLMDGEIGVVSRPGVGSNFWFTIQGEACPQAATVDRDLDGVRVLIVAATGMSRDTLRNQLTTFGGTSVVVPNAEKALAALQTEAGDRLPCDVVLIDTHALDGLALVREIRADEATKSLPVVLVSKIGRGQAALKKTGVDGSLTKPVRQAELLACVARVTGRSAVSIPPGDQEAVGSDPEEAVAGARILVAEDNGVNREVAMTMLELLKCRVDVVVDGAEALEAVRRERYDLAFLDCQMPNLDGYETAREIRRLEQKGQVGTEGAVGRIGHLPIVALTAHSAPADRDRCLESGMDDYLSKPYTLQMLLGVLGKWVGSRVGSAALPPSPTSVHPGSDATDDAPISEAALEQILELDRLSGGGVFARVARIFLKEAPTTLEDLRAGVREGDVVRVARAAHELKSASFNVGAVPLATVSQELEALAKNGTSEGLASFANRLDELYVAVKAALEARLEDQDHRDDVVAV